MLQHNISISWGVSWKSINSMWIFPKKLAFLEVWYLGWNDFYYIRCMKEKCIVKVWKSWCFINLKLYIHQRIFGPLEMPSEEEIGDPIIISYIYQS